MHRHPFAPRLADLALPAGLVTLMVATAVQAQDAKGKDDIYLVDTVTVTATRTTQGRPLSSIPGSVTVIGREQIAEQAAISGDLGGILTQLVPGFGPSSQSQTNFGQELRGRDFLVLIDGVPQTTPLRDSEKALRIIDPHAIERIEVIRGAVATYGYGATGGIINIITRSGGGEGARFTTEVGATGSMTHFDDSLGGFVYQGVSGGAGRLDYSVNLSAQSRGGFFDADGDRIAPAPFPGGGGGLADTYEYNAQTKLGYQLTENQRLRLSANYYQLKQDTDYSMDANPDDPAFAIEEPPKGEEERGTENFSVSLDHTVEEVLGGTLSSQLYYQDFETVFSFYPPWNGQSKVVSEKIGARFAHERAFLGDNHVVYGIDFLDVETGQPIVPDGKLTPFVDQFSYAPFVQLEVPVGDSWLLRGGVRHERVSIEVDDFMTVLTEPRTVQGGELDYSETVFNLGAVWFLSDNQEVFAGFSQGFSVVELARVLRGTSAESVEAVDPEAQVVDNYEIGWRGYFDRWSASVSLFYNTSELGTTYGADYRAIRQEEEIYGIEIAADYRVTDAWTVGGTYAWQEGRADTDEDGDLDAYLPVTRISPPKLTLYGEYEPSERWSARLQLTRFGDRNHDEYAAAFGGTDVDAYTVVDAYVSMGIGPGRLSLGIGNLLNEDYITTLGQVYAAFGDEFDRPTYQAVPGRGRHFSLQYAMRY